MAHTAVLVYVRVCFIIPLFYFKVMVRMKWGIYDTFADENLCRQNYEVYWMKHNSVLCGRVFRQVEQRFPQWSSAFGGLNFAYIVCDIVVFPSYGIGLHLESADKKACEYTYTVLFISLINLEFCTYQTCWHRRILAFTLLKIHFAASWVTLFFFVIIRCVFS